VSRQLVSSPGFIGCEVDVVSLITRERRGAGHDDRYERNEDAKARQQAEGNRKMEDVVMIYRTISMPNGGESHSEPTLGGVY
jgi:hypothetical protein